MGIIKTRKEVKRIEKSCELLSALFEFITPYVKDGADSSELDKIAEEFIVKHGGVPSFKNYAPDGTLKYPATLCISINEEVVHGVPKPGKKLEKGDIVGVDAGIKLHGYCSDAAFTYPIGEVSEEALSLARATYSALWAGIEACVPGNTVGDVGCAIEKEVKRHGFDTIKELFGHGIGKNPHEEPNVPNFCAPGKGMALLENMVLAIEVMTTAGSHQIVVDEEDMWTIRTADGSLSAHYEHTVLITRKGPKVLTEHRVGDDLLRLIRGET